MKLKIGYFLALLVVLPACGHDQRQASPTATSEAELRAAEKALAEALTSSDPTAWVSHYTEDAVFVSPGDPAVQGRSELVAMAKAMPPLSSVVITPLKTEVSGNIAAVYVHATWVTGAQTGSPDTTRVRNVIVWRKEADGRWRVALELLHPEPPAK